MLDRRELLKLSGATVGVGLTAGLGGAQDETTTETPTETPTGTTTETEGTPQAPPEGEFYAAARLTGAAQPEPVDTSATGAAVFTRTDEELAYELFVADIENVTMAHIHVGGRDEEGDVVQWLYPAPDATEPDPISGGFSGLLAADAITGDNLVGPMEDDSLDSLLEEMELGNAYVNVHTEANPGGEIRGQIGTVEVTAPTTTPGTETTEAGTDETTEAGTTETTEAGTDETTEAGMTETTEAGMTETTEAGMTETNSTAGGMDTPEY